jgi:hypothetical protein
MEKLKPKAVKEMQSQIDSSAGDEEGWKVSSPS